jgi:long-chain acyl-CoA synthetase
LQDLPKIPFGKETEMNLAELAEQNIREFGEYTGLVFYDKEYTNVQMHESAMRLAGGLKKMGIKAGDKVIVLMPNSPEVLIAYEAIWRVGGVIVPVIFLLESHEVTYIANDCEAAAVITAPDFLFKVEESREKVSALQNVIIIGDEEQPDTVLFDKLIEDSDPDPDIHPTDDDDTAVLIYTSGTTGRPKGVMLTHKNLHSHAVNGRASILDEEIGDVGLSVLPLSHSYGLGLLVGGYLNKGKGVLLRWFNLEEVFEAIDQHKVEGMAGVPTMFVYMLHYPEADKYDTSSVKSWTVGAAPMALEQLQQFEKKFGGKMFVGYGLSEMSPTVAFEREPFERKDGSTGTAMNGVEIKIVDEDDNELPPNEVGEVACRGDNMMKGYYKMPEETEQAMKGGWLHTGDMGYLDEGGYLYIVERKKDLIIRGGFNIFPKDVEEVLYTHPAVGEAAVVGKPDELMGEEVVAYVAFAPGASATAEELIAHCQSNLAKYKCPKHVEFVDELPKNPIGKIQKRELRDRATKTSF